MILSRNGVRLGTQGQTLLFKFKLSRRRISNEGGEKELLPVLLKANPPRKTYVRVNKLSWFDSCLLNDTEDC
jgi:hypothetical protein